MELQNQLDSKSCARAKQICRADLPGEIHNTKKFHQGAGFKLHEEFTSRQKQLDEYNDAVKPYLNLNYMGNAGEQLVRSSIKKRKRNI